MSEYQYYDFRSIDKPLTRQQKKEVADLSSRSRLTAYSAEFVYNYGGFHGDVIDLMKSTFDVMLYVANWGARRLVFRIPKNLIDTKEIRPYFLSDEIEHYQTSDHTVLDLNFNDEESGGEWLEGEGLLDDMLLLREELMQGDYRVLYLAWLKAAESMMAFDALDEQTKEPMVPAGLNELTAAQEEYIDFIELDEVLVKVAAKNSPKIIQHPSFKADIALLSQDEKDHFLQRLSDNEAGLSLTLNQHL